MTPFKRHLFLFFLLISSITAWSRSVLPPSDTARLSCVREAGKLLDEVFGLMQKNYFRRNIVKWDSLHNVAKSRLAATDNCEDAFAVLDWCFRELNEPHSFIMSPRQASIYNYEVSPKPALSQLVGSIKAEVPEKGIAYINLPWISTTDDDICTQLADSIQHIIAKLDGQGITKWIIDLRQNTGGNCWPMLAGIGPLLGEGVCAYFVGNNEKVPVSYSDGAAMQGRNVRCKTSGKGYQVKQQKKWIAILTGPHTSSSGEIVALAFKGKEQVYLYGEPTAGLTTGNATYTLSNNSLLVLTVCSEADRHGRIVDGKIIPDQIIAQDQANPRNDAIKSAALMWLMTEQ